MTNNNYHAVLSPSGAHRWLACPGSVCLSKDIPDEGSEFAQEGTQAHELAATLLSGGGADMAQTHPAEMSLYIQEYVDYIRDVVKATGGALFVEVKVPIDHLTGEDGATGTADAVVLAGDDIIVVDLKYGRGQEVFAEGNEQLMMYALGALKKYEALGDFKQARLVIYQPRVKRGPDEWTCDVEHLVEFALKVQTGAKWATDIVQGGLEPSYAPGEKQCKWCRAKAICPALRDWVTAQVSADFDTVLVGAPPAEKVASADNEELATMMAAIPLMEDWIKAVRGRVESELLAGESVPGFKLVQGRMGARKWRDDDEAEQTMKYLRLKQGVMYVYKVASPTVVEKHIAKTLPKIWDKVKEMIVQEKGSPSVAPESDKRPALVMEQVNDFV